MAKCKVAYLENKYITSESRVYMRLKDIFGKEEHPLDNDKVNVVLIIEDPKSLTFEQIVILDLVFHEAKNIALSVLRPKTHVVRDLISNYVIVSIDELLYLASFNQINLCIPDKLLLKKKGEKEYYYSEYKDYTFTGGPAPCYFASKQLRRVIRLARKALNRRQEIETVVYTKEFSCYNGDFTTECPQKESTGYKVKVDKHYYKMYRYIIIYGDVTQLTSEDRQTIFTWKCPKFMHKYSEQDAIQEMYDKYYRNKYRDDEDITTYQKYFSRFFKLDGLDITEEVISYMMDALTKMCQDYVALSSEDAFEFINNFVNINLRYEEYLEMNEVLRLPDVVDFVVSDMVYERDILVDADRFFEDHKDDEYEAINSSYLGEDDTVWELANGEWVVLEDSSEESNDDDE